MFRLTRQCGNFLSAIRTHPIRTHPIRASGDSSSMFFVFGFDLIFKVCCVCIGLTSVFLGFSWRCSWSFFVVTPYLSLCICHLPKWNMMSTYVWASSAFIIHHGLSVTFLSPDLRLFLFDWKINLPALDLQNWEDSQPSTWPAELKEKSDQFRFIRAACLANLKGSIGLMLSKDSDMRVTIPHDLSTRLLWFIDTSKNLVWVKLRDYAISRENPILIWMFLVRVVMIW